MAWLLALATGCARSDGTPQLDANCTPPAELGSPLVRDPSPLLSADDSGRCRIDEQGRLSQACVPRCAPAARAPFYACRDIGCEETVLGSDPNPALNALDGNGVRALDCVGCVRAARTLCVRQACPVEVAIRDTCLAGTVGGEGCAAESAALNDCFLNRQQLYEPCWFLAVETCFSGK